MEIVYHSLVRRDLREVLDWYDERSGAAGDRFFADFEKTVSDLRTERRNGFALDRNTRKIFLKHFPYSLTYEKSGDIVYVFVVKHQKRHPEYGMRRKRLRKK